MTAMFSSLLRRLPGTLAVLAVLTLLAVAAPIPGLYTLVLQSANALSALGALAAWLSEHLTCRRASPGWLAVGVGGVATSGWPGRSHSLGLAEAGTVLADTAAAADVADTPPQAAGGELLGRRRSGGDRLARRR